MQNSAPEKGQEYVNSRMPDEMSGNKSAGETEIDRVQKKNWGLAILKFEIPLHLFRFGPLNLGLILLSIAQRFSPLMESEVSRCDSAGGAPTEII